MEDNLWYDHFIECLYKKYPVKTQLTEALVDLLCIERESIYRRLRKEVLFTVHEVAKIASTWGISLDETIGTNFSKISFQMQPINYLLPSKGDLEFMHKRIQKLEQVNGSPYSEYIVIGNHLSRSFCAGFDQLYKFTLFKWAYQYNKEISNIPYSEIMIPEDFSNEIKKYYQLMKTIAHTSYVLDKMLFSNLIDEINFFNSILLITDEDKQKIKKDLFALLDYLLVIANTGYFPETKNKVQIYISMLNINTNYSYINYGNGLESCRVHAFKIHDLINHNQEMTDQFKMWMLLKKRSSIQISEVDEKSRIEFFAKQRQLIQDL